MKKKPNAPPRETHRIIHSTIPVHLLPCRMCGFPAQIWQRWQREDIWYTYVSCSNDEDVDGQECVFAPPGRGEFYCERKADAFRYWNLMMGPRPAAPGLNTLDPKLLNGPTPTGDVPAPPERAPAQDAARYAYLRERCQFDRIQVRKVDLYPPSSYVLLTGVELDHEVDICMGAGVD